MPPERPIWQIVYVRRIVNLLLMGWGSFNNNGKVRVLSPEEDAGRWSEQPGRFLVSNEQWVKIAKFLSISERERQVCQLLFEGLTREEIAERMKLKVRTIRHYLERIHAKLSVNHRVALVLRIIQVRDHLEQLPDGDMPEQ